MTIFHRNIGNMEHVCAPRDLRCKRLLDIFRGILPSALYCIAETENFSEGDHGMKRTTMLIGIVSLVVMVSASMGYAQGRGMGGCCGAGPGAAIWNELSPDQQKQMTSLRTELLKKVEGVRAEIAKKRVEMLDLASKDKPDEQAIEKKRQEIWALRDSMRDDRRAMGSKIRGLLTPEQKQKLGPFGPGMGMGGMGSGGGCPMGRGFGGGKGCGGCGAWGGGMSSL
jgi:Spy/CpxP family protein refolding chaperone